MATNNSGSGYNTNPTTILRNRDEQQLETVGGEGLLEDRFVDWWAMCCRCRRWQENVLPAHSLYSRIYRTKGENCCDHCRNLTTVMVRRQRERSGVHPTFNYAAEGTASPTTRETGDGENEKERQGDKENKEGEVAEGN
ncbi:hypothetical protein QBC36DRAFT_295961 [Triangularia setosa]|uniref:Uncharacterized protein n=1 Tax=Triangularia setosa TaxID=2587417 RepID=A0AAN7A3A2_9PEZI|nr:hypothetical protein QBC36DRAFT_295961 [Podospora setosa]